jgi:hypothetical protein
MLRISSGVCVFLLLSGSVLPAAAQSPAVSSGIPEGTAAQRAIGPPAVAKNCAAMAKVSFAATNNQETISTTSTTFVDLPPLSVRFNLPGPSQSCLKVELAAVTFAAVSGELISMRVLLDGTTELLPGEPQWSGDDDENANGEWARAHAADFYIFGVPPGTHTVTAQWRTHFGNTAFSHWRSMGVHHK